MEEIQSIIKEYKEVISDPGISDYAKVMAKIHAFDEILAEIDRINILSGKTVRNEKSI